MRRSAIARKIPTPIETVRISTIFSSSETCSASIVRSGSDIVIMIPITNATKAMSQIFPDAAIEEPIFVPSGCIDISAPMLKRAIPKTRKTIPMRKTSICPGSIGVIVKERTRMISAIGNIERSDSFSLYFIIQGVPLCDAFGFENYSSVIVEKVI